MMHFPCYGQISIALHARNLLVRTYPCTLRQSSIGNEQLPISKIFDDICRLFKDEIPRAATFGGFLKWGILKGCSTIVPPLMETSIYWRVVHPAISKLQPALNRGWVPLPRFAQEEYPTWETYVTLEIEDGTCSCP